ncbi:MAG TPA: hypothetical protein VI756_22580 [Blastocatellia bacterium]
MKLGRLNGMEESLAKKKPDILAAWVRPSLEAPRTRHYSGLPPELTDGEDYRVELPRAEIITIEPEPNAAGIFLFRYLRDGTFITDTWHESVEDAKFQAEYEYGTTDQEWVAVPGDVTGPVAFLVEHT